jgi:hypothetical protein
MEIGWGDFRIARADRATCDRKVGCRVRDYCEPIARRLVRKKHSTPYFAQLGNGALMLDASTRRASAKRLALRIRGWRIGALI